MTAQLAWGLAVLAGAYVTLTEAIPWLWRHRTRAMRAEAAARRDLRHMNRLGDDIPRDGEPLPDEDADDLSLLEDQTWSWR